MIKIPLLLVGVFLLTFSFVPFLHAYETTDQRSFSLDGTTGLYLIDFAFGHADHDVYIPVQALRTDQSQVNALSYSVYDDEDERARGSAVGLVLSNVRVENGMYRIPKGMRATFTLFVLFKRSTNETGTKFRVQVSHLPFSFDNETRLQLNPSELQYYVTPQLQLLSGPRAVIGKINVVVSPSSGSPSSLSSQSPQVTIHQ